MGRDGRPANYVIAPDGRTLTMADLPAANIKRWVMRRKGEVVAAVQGGLLTLEDACKRYNLSVEEYLSWQHAMARHGLNGLRVTQLHDRRETTEHHAA